MARGFALLRMPKMPELKGKTFPGFDGAALDTDTIRYKDKNREKLRQKMLAELKERPPLPKRNFIKNKSWSKQKTKTERRKKRSAKRKHEEVLWPFFLILLDESEALIYSRLTAVVCWQGSDVEDEDMKELLNDTRILKRLKKGKISEEDFEKQITTKPKNKIHGGGASGEEEA